MEFVNSLKTVYKESSLLACHVKLLPSTALHHVTTQRTKEKNSF